MLAAPLREFKPQKNAALCYQVNVKAYKLLGALSSQASLAGYVMVMKAVDQLDSVLPMMTPAAREMKGNPIYGMPIINADLTKNILVLKYRLASGFAGVDNPLFFKPNTRIVFGDAKETLGVMIRRLSD